MRFFACIAMVAALLAPDAGADEIVGLADFRFGMTMEQARALDPAIEWTETTFGERTGLSTSAEIEFGGKSFTRQLVFQGNSFSFALLGRAEDVASAAECESGLMALVSALETDFGPLTGPAELFEYGEPMGARATQGGSEVRFYDFLSFNMRIGVATKRDGGFIMVQATARPTSAGRSPQDMSCHFTIRIDATGPPSYPPLTPPTPAQFQAATPYQGGAWVRTPTGDSFSWAMPPTIQFLGPSNVALACLVIEEGALNCAVSEETPPHFWLGAAMLNVSREFRVPEQVNGVSTLGAFVWLPMPMSNAPRPIDPNHRDPAEFERLLAEAPSVEEVEAAANRQGAEDMEPPEWVQRPSGQDFANYYPIDALDAGQEGRVVLDCLTAEGGTLRCRVAEETPPGWDFGLAALGIAQSFRVTMEGEGAIGRLIRVTLPFRMR